MIGRTKGSKGTKSASGLSQDRAVVIEPVGKLTLGNRHAELRTLVEQALAVGARRVVIDFRRALRVDFFGVNQLIAARRMVAGSAATLTVRNLPPRVAEVLRLAERRHRHI